MRPSHSRMMPSELSPARKPGISTTGSPVPRGTPAPRYTGSTSSRASSACHRTSATRRPHQRRAGGSPGGGGVGSKEAWATSLIHTAYPAARFGDAHTDRTHAMSDLDQLVDGRLADPHSVLGAHPHDGGVVVRAYRPAAEKVVVKPLDGQPPVDATQVHPGGVFQAELPTARLPLRYELEVAY